MMNRPIVRDWGSERYYLDDWTDGEHAHAVFDDTKYDVISMTTAYSCPEECWKAFPGASAWRLELNPMPDKADTDEEIIIHIPPGCRLPIQTESFRGLIGGIHSPGWLCIWECEGRVDDFEADVIVAAAKEPKE